MDLMFGWEEGDRFSFEDSDHFEEDSLCSWISEPESLCNNWRGWKKQNGQGGQQQGHPFNSSREEIPLRSLVELAAREVACHIPFEVVEHVYPPVPEQLQLRIAFWSFPENEEDIRLYSCLANGSADEFQRGEHLLKAKSVRDPLQIGFHLSATVVVPPALGQSTKGSHNVAVTFDRRRITSCNCTCTSTASWCAHVVAVCLYRIIYPNSVCLRAPVSESLGRLHRDQLQKFAQYLISELPQQILPTAQRLLDELLSSQATAINTVCGAPDPTAGPSANEQTAWCLDEATLHENIRKMLIKFCVPSPIVFSDVNYLSSTAPPAAAEWSSLLRPLRGREPEGMWSLLSIVREMYRRSDRNAIPLLEILTEECLACEQILIWWFNTKVTLHNNGSGLHGNRNSSNSSTHTSQHACSSLCDEIVLLWRLAALNPAFSPKERTDLKEQLQEWHIKAIEKVCKAKSSSGGTGGVRKTDIEIFTGFKPAIEACLLDWNDFPIEGITYNPSHANKRWHQFYMRPHTGDHRDGSSNQTSGNEHPPPIQGTAEGRTRTPRSCLNPPIQHVIPEHRLPVQKSSSNDYNRSSLSSEGFCENDVAEILAQAKEYGESSFIDDIDVLSEHDSQDLRDDKELEPSISTEIIVVMASPDKPDKVKNKEKTRSSTKVSIVQAKTSCHVSDEGNFTDKEKSSPEDLDSDWSSAPESHCKTLKPVRTDRKEDKYDPSESQQSSDEYQVYYYDTKAKVPQIEKTKEKLNEENSLFANIKKIDDKMEILYARAEALHAHGHTKEACKLAVQLAEELLANPPDLLREPPPPPVKPGKRKKAMANHSISQLATATLTKVAFLVTVLSEEPDYHHLAFKVGMFGLEMPRPPASSKALEVKLANQESDLVVLLKRIPLGPAELNVIHERAEQLKEGKLKSRGEALLPLMLATFIFDALCLPGSNNLSSRCNFHSNGRLPTDPQLGFDAAVTALGLKANVSEADHPLLCEGTRRQRGELAISLLVQYKDDQEKLVKIMDKLLDKEVHQMYKAPSLSAYYTTKSTPHHQTAPVKHAPGAPESHSGSLSQPKKSTSSESEDNHQPGTSGVASNPSDLQGKPPSTSSHHEKQDGIILEKSLMGMNISSNRTGARAKEASHRYSQRLDDNLREDTSSPTWEEDYKAWEAKFRCTNLKTHKRHSAGMASIDSSAPETTSSDNSPTLIRRSGWGKPTGPGSDSGSSGKSSDSLGSSSSGDKVARSKIRENESPTSTFGMVRFASTTMMDSLARSSTPCIKTSRFKGKRVTPSIPNQPSEASAHFMVELAKTVLTKAGGNSSTSLFTQPSTTQSHSGPHRALHMCAFQIGLYALGLHNCVSPNWLSRTYSSHVSWITGQAMEIGSAAITFLIDTWEGHLTPPEVASLADRASRGRDPNMVRAAAELALSCLPHAHALNPNEIQRALIQCKEQSNQMLERACLAVESAAKGGGVYPEVLYDVARRWYELYEESMLGPSHNNNAQENIIPAQENLILPEQPLVFDPNVSIPVERVSPPNMQVIATQPPNNNITVTIPPPPFPLPQPLPVTQVHYSYSFVPQMPNFGPHYTQPPLAFHTHNIHPAYITAPYAYTGQTFTNIHPMHPPNPQPYYQNGSQIRPGPSTVYSSIVVTTGQNRLAPTPQMPQMTHPTHQVTPVANQLTQAQLNYVLNAYRVGMLATETLARRVHDDRPQAKYARNPPYGEDLKWLLGVAKKLGSTHLQQFCISALNSVVSPFILHDIAIEAAHYLGSNSPAPTPQHLRSPVLSPLVQKCLQMYIQCTHQKIHHITPAEYDEFVSIIRSARNAFQMTPSGMVQFNELLQSLRRTKSCKKELWQRIMNGLAMPNM